MPAILKTDAELAGNVESGLVRKAHARSQWRRFSMDKVDRLVDLHADAMASAV